MFIKYFPAFALAKANIMQKIGTVFFAGQIKTIQQGNDINFADGISPCFTVASRRLIGDL